MFDKNQKAFCLLYDKLQDSCGMQRKEIIKQMGMIKRKAFHDYDKRFFNNISKYFYRQNYPFLEFFPYLNVSFEKFCLFFDDHILIEIIERCRENLLDKNIHIDTSFFITRDTSFFVTSLIYSMIKKTKHGELAENLSKETILFDAPLLLSQKDKDLDPIYMNKLWSIFYSFELEDQEKWIEDSIKNLGFVIYPSIENRLLQKQKYLILQQEYSCLSEINNIQEVMYGKLYGLTGYKNEKARILEELYHNNFFDIVNIKEFVDEDWTEHDLEKFQKGMKLKSDITIKVCL